MKTTWLAGLVFVMPFLMSSASAMDADRCQALTAETATVVSAGEASYYLPIAKSEFLSLTELQKDAWLSSAERVSPQDLSECAPVDGHWNDPFIALWCRIPWWRTRLVCL